MGFCGRGDAERELHKSHRGGPDGVAICLDGGGGNAAAVWADAEELVFLTLTFIPISSAFPAMIVRVSPRMEGFCCGVCSEMLDSRGHWHSLESCCVVDVFERDDSVLVNHGLPRAAGERVLVPRGVPEVDVIQVFGFRPREEEEGAPFPRPKLNL